MTPVMLFPGAGTRRDHPSLVAIERGLKPRRVRRENFDYQNIEGRRPAPKAPVLVEEIARLIKRTRGPWVLGGRSMGGRMCSLAVAQGRVPRAVALVMVAYPLHPPGRPDVLRTEHFGYLKVPCLFVSGDRDAFGTPDEFERATAAIPASVTHVWLPGVTHDLRGVDAIVAARINDWLTAQDL